MSNHNNESRPAPAVQVPDDAALDAIIEGSDGAWHDDEFRISGSDLMTMLRKAAHTPAPVATEAVAQGGVVDVEKVMALVDQYGQEKWNQGDNQYRRGCESSSTYYSEEAGRIRDRIRALLASPAVPVGDGWMPEYWLVTRDDGAEWPERNVTQVLNLHRASHVFTIKPVGCVELPLELRALPHAPAATKKEQEDHE